jgi:hypothetical protein
MANVRSEIPKSEVEYEMQLHKPKVIKCSNFKVFFFSEKPILLEIWELPVLFGPLGLRASHKTQMKKKITHRLTCSNMFIQYSFVDWLLCITFFSPFQNICMSSEFYF